MNHKILIHIGMPKTGTTTLQKFLFENQNALKEEGWLYPDIFMNKNEISEEGRWANVKFDYCIGVEILEDKIKKMQEGLKDYNVILSSEKLWAGNDELIKRLLKLPNEVKIVVYLRAQDSAIEATYKQFIKNSDALVYSEEEEYQYLSAKEYFEKAKEDFKYLNRLDELERLVGKNNLLVLSYEKAREENICKQFVGILGCKYSKFKKVKSENISLNKIEVEVKRNLNCRVKKYANVVIQRAIEKSYRESFEKNNSVCRNIFETSVLSEIKRYYLEENNEISEKYLLNEKIRFAEKNELINEKFDLKDEYIKTLERIIIYQIYEEKYKKYIDGGLIPRGKKIIFWGAGKNCEYIVNHQDYPAYFIVDNDIEKSGNTIGGIKIVQSGSILDWEPYFIIVTINQYAEIKKFLIEKGLEEKKNFISVFELQGII